MLQWFLSFPEFAEFTEMLFYLGKTRMSLSTEAMARRDQHHTTWFKANRLYLFSFSSFRIYYRPHTEYGEDNVYTDVCLFTYRPPSI